MALPSSAQPTPPDSAVNVVLIFADDLGYGDLSSYGQTAWETPNLDRMAAEGARLTQFYVPVPYCAPSRATLLTGRYPFHHGFTQNPAPDAPPDAGLDTIGLDSAEVTLGEAFQQAGYATSIIGKWHLGHQPGFYPTEHGFDEYYGILYSNDMRPVELIEDTTVIEYPVVQATLTRRYTERALDFIERNQEQPFSSTSPTRCRTSRLPPRRTSTRQRRGTTCMPTSSASLTTRWARSSRRSKNSGWTARRW